VGANYYRFYSGYDIETHNNPADFFLDVILGNIPQSLHASSTCSLNEDPQAEVKASGEQTIAITTDEDDATSRYDIIVAS